MAIFVNVLMVLLLSPFLIIIFYVFNTFPILTCLNKYFHSMNNMNTLFVNTFLYIFITLRFLSNTFLYIILNLREMSRVLTKSIISYYFLLQCFLIINPVLEYLLLILCGDIETNPGPYNENKQTISVCHWNLNGIAAHSYTKLSMLEAYNALINYDIICISETFIDSSYLDGDHSLKLEGYELIRADHPNNTKRGGVCIYSIKSIYHLKSERIFHL